MSLLQKLAVGILVLFSLPSTVFSEGVEWEQDIQVATTKAANDGKLILLHFTAPDWCRPCQALETFVFPSPLVVHAMDEHVVPVKIDVDLRPELVAEYGVSGVPADVILTPAGRVVTKRNSPTSVGEYVRMIKNLGKTLNGESNEDPNRKIAHDIQQIIDESTPKKAALAQYEDFTPEAPTHRQPSPSDQSMNLARKSTRVMTNPFFQQETPKKKPAKPATIAGINPPSQTEIQNTQTENEFGPADSSNDFAPANVEPKAMSNTLAPMLEPSQEQEEQVRNEFFARAEEAKRQAVIQQQQAAKVAKKQELAKRKLAYEKPQPKIDRSKFALKGKCPVTLLTESKWVDGDPSWGCVHRGRTYLFKSKLHLNEFQKAPDKYSPLLAGYDPVIYHRTGELIEGLEENGVFMGKINDQRIVLFKSMATQDEFQRNPTGYIETVRQAMSSDARSAKIR